MVENLSKAVSADRQRDGQLHGGPHEVSGDSVEHILQALRRKGYATDGAKFPIGRPDRATVPLVTRTGISVVGKLYPAGRGAITYANMQAVWHSSFGAGRQLPGLPQPLDYLPDIGVLIMERIAGRLLMEFDALDTDCLSEAVRLVASLHECQVHPRKLRDAREIVRVRRRNAENIATLAPEYAGCLGVAVEALEAAQVEDLELAPCHGDFSPQNVLVGPDRVVLIDWDHLQRADPTRDITQMGTWCWVWALRQKRPPDWSVLQHVVEQYSALRPRALTAVHLRFHIAAGLLRSAHSLATLWPEDAYLVPQLATEALRQLHQLL